MLRRGLAVLSLLLCASLAGAQGAVTLLDTDVSTAVTAQLSPLMPLARLAQGAQKYILAQAKFSGYGAGGTNVTAYLQTSLDAGVTWIDIMSFQFTTANATKVSKVGLATALAAGVTPTDGALTANTILDGVIGDRLRVKYTTTGTYTGTYASTTIGYVDITDVSPGLRATQTVVYQNGTDLTATKALNIQGVIYTFVAAVAVAGDVKISGTSDGTMLNLTRCINKSGGTEGAGQDYMSAGGIAHPYVTASLNAATDTLTLTSILYGVAGNSYTLDTTAPNAEPTFTLGGALFANGEEWRRVVVNGVVYTFVGTVGADGDVKIGGSADATMLNLTRCINKSGGTPGAGQDYMSAGGVANPYVAAAQTAGSDIVTLTARTSGVGGNSYTLTSPAPYTEATFTLGTFSGGSASLPHLKVSALVR